MIVIYSIHFFTIIYFVENVASDGPEKLEVTINGRACTFGETVDVGEIMTVTTACNPAEIKYTWTDTTSTNTIIGSWQSLKVTEGMVGNRLFEVEVCNVIPIPSLYMVCCNTTVNIAVSSGKCLQ